MAEPPYGVISNCLKSGKVVPFLGAGASLVGRASSESWNPSRPTFLPSGRELSQCLATETSFPSSELRDREDLAKVSSYYADVNGRRTLRERLRDVLVHEFPYGALHEFLAAVPTPLVIVTTNYDTLVEQAFLARGKPYDLVIYPADRKDFANAVLWWRHAAPEPREEDPNELDIDLGKTTVIYKMHGTINREANKWDNFVITEEDYIEFLSRMTANTAVPSLFLPYFRERSFLFLGYGLGDWNLRVILKNLTKFLPAKCAAGYDEEMLPSWAVQYRPSELECRLWARRNISIFDLTIDEFVAKMKEQMK